MSLILTAANNAYDVVLAAHTPGHTTGGGGGGAGAGADAGTTGKNLADTLRNFIAPIVLLVIGVVALTFLVQRQVTQFLQFAAIAVGVGVFFYVPGVVEALAKIVAKALGA